MENIEQLKLDNAKLQERLNNAAKFFREQKAQIEELTKEKNELNSNIESKDQAYKTLQETYNKVFAENKQLKDQVESCEFNAESDANNLEDLNKQLNEYKLKLQKSEEDLQKRVEQIRATEKTYDEEQKKIIAARDEWHKKYEEAVKKSISIENEKNKQIEVYNIKFRELELKFDAVSKEYFKKFEDQKKQLENVNHLYDELNDQKCAYENDYRELIKQLEEKDNKIKDLETINDNINKLYDELENQKNAYENDYINLEEKFKESEKQNENVCKFNKQDINDFCDNMLDFFKNHQL